MTAFACAALGQHPPVNAKVFPTPCVRLTEPGRLYLVKEGEMNTIDVFFTLGSWIGGLVYYALLVSATSGLA